MLACLPDWIKTLDFKGISVGQAKTFLLASACLLAR
jgi:hypothetical protein